MNLNEQGILTDWRAQSEGKSDMDRIWESEVYSPAEEGWTSHNMKRILVSEGHSLPREHKK